MMFRVFLLIVEYFYVSWGKYELAASDHREEVLVQGLVGENSGTSSFCPRLVQSIMDFFPIFKSSECKLTVTERARGSGRWKFLDIVGVIVYFGTANEL